MSYSLGVVGSSKADAKARVHDEFEKVVRAQPDHQRDRWPAEHAVAAMVDCLHESEASAKLAVRVQVNGSISGKWESGGISEVAGVNLSATVSYANP